MKPLNIDKQANWGCELQYSGYADAVTGFNEAYCLNGSMESSVGFQRKVLLTVMSN